MAGADAAAASPPSNWVQYAYRGADGAGAAPRLEEDEELLKTYHDVALTLGDCAEQGVGTLHVTTRRAVWVSGDGSSVGFAVPFRDMVMHAVSSDTASFPRPCIYAQLQGGFADEDEDDEAAPEVPDEAAVSLEMRLSPADGTALDDMFKSFCDAAALNPDDEDEFGGGEGEGEFFYDEEEVFAGADPATRERMLAHYDDVLVVGGDGEGGGEDGGGDDGGRFDDPEEDEEEGAAAGGGANGRA